MTAVTTRSLILCVDDYEDILDGWRVLWENEGYRVMTAADANRAIELLISQPIDEVILDYQLPAVTGDLVAREMKTLRPNVPILIMSDERRLPEEGLELVDDFLLKGGSISVFLERVRALLDATVARRMYPRFRAARIA